MVLLPEDINSGELRRALKVNKCLLLNGDQTIHPSSKATGRMAHLKVHKVDILIIGIGTCPRVLEDLDKEVQDQRKEGLKATFILVLRQAQDLLVVALHLQDLAQHKKRQITITETMALILRYSVIKGNVYMDFMFSVILIVFPCLVGFVKLRGSC